MENQLFDVKLKVDGAERTFEISGRLPLAMAEAQSRLMWRDISPTKVWAGYTIGSEAAPDHMFIVEGADFNGYNHILILRGRIEGPK